MDVIEGIAFFVNNHPKYFSIGWDDHPSRKARVGVFRKAGDELTSTQEGCLSGEIPGLGDRSPSWWENGGILFGNRPW